jgi:hypothetical protein
LSFSFSWVLFWAFGLLSIKIIKVLYWVYFWCLMLSNFSTHGILNKTSVLHGVTCFYLFLNKEQLNLSKYNWLCDVLPYTSHSWLANHWVSIQIPIMLVSQFKVIIMSYSSIKSFFFAFQDYINFLVGFYINISMGFSSPCI